jgi:TATA-box binding protein (TBP) (component of TFIID and TFIIIB)
MILGELKKSSSTLNGTLTPGIYNLDIIYENLEIGGDILFTKYNGEMKTSKGVIPSSTFNNQITIKMSNGVNIKIFKSKTFSISGAGDVDTALEKARSTLEKVLLIIDNIKIKKKVKIHKIGNFYTYYKDKIISVKDGKYTCNYPLKGIKITIDGGVCIEFDVIPGTYIQLKHKEKIKLLYNNLAENIGYVEYTMKRKSKSLFIKGCIFSKKDENNYEISNSYGNILGVMKVFIHPGKSTQILALPEYIELNLKSCSEDTTTIETIKFSNSNYNLKLLNTTSINRQKICSYLETSGVPYVYNPSAYPGIKFTIDSVKITIFRTGSVLFSSKVDIKKEAYPFIIKLFNEDLSSEVDDSVTDSELTIWDI